MPASLIKFEGVSFRKFQHIVFPNTNWEMREGENWAIVGTNGSGKTTFLEAVEGRLLKVAGNVEYHLKDINGEVLSDSHKLIASVYFSDRSVNYGDFYYQQRYHATETDGIITVREFLGLNNGNTLPELDALDIRRLLDMEIIKLSNGQFKKMLIVKALLKKPRLLLLDNLYTGLDTRARVYISETIERIAGTGTQIIMAANNDTIPDTMTHIMEVDRFSVNQTLSRKSHISLHTTSGKQMPLPVLPEAPEKNFNVAVNLDHVTIRYNDTIVIDHVDWTIRHGERWSLMGPNGSGKSMLLSLVFADNPQAYANRITLFDRKRGTGESIWDIKDRIGFVSPEMHVYFGLNKTCREVVTSGLRENPYKYRPISQNDILFMETLFAYFSLKNLENELFQRISTGYQNIVLLIRALIKNPSMLVLDEPFQGIDTENIMLAKQLLDAFCENRTMIFVSHHPDELPSCINRHLYIKNGRVISN